VALVTARVWLWPSRVPPKDVPRPSLHTDFRRALFCAILALAALIVGAGLGGAHDPHHPDRRLAAIALAGVFGLFGLLAVRSAGGQASRVTALRAGPATAAAVRMGTTVIGVVVVVVAMLDMLQVPVQRLLVGGAITGVVLGISAQQSLGNVSAGILMLIARPFTVGDDVTVLSGSLGGPLQGRITSIGLVYTTLLTDRGRLSLPNSGLLAAAVGTERDRPPDCRPADTSVAAPAQTREDQLRRHQRHGEGSGREYVARPSSGRPPGR
jgi:small-conductance mechanosensitive channel